MITKDLLEQLLHEDESTSLDFKSAQYPFRGATDEEKTELLKDVLALANAWRRTDGYILVGVEEVRGGRSRPVGVTEHLDDAELQQFVNSKTQRPVEFSYRQASIDRVSIGVIHVAVQHRPIYLLKGFGRLSKETVYLRRGSSTAQATPDEVAKMGQAFVSNAKPPGLTFGAAAFGSRTITGLDLDITVEVLSLPSLGDYGRRGNGLLRDPTTNRDYLRELAEYVRVKKLTRPLGLVVSNSVGPTAKGVEWRARAARDDDVVLLAQLPERPSTHTFVSIPDRIRSLFQVPTVEVESFSDHWEVLARFGDILPGDKGWLAKPLLVGASVDKEVQFEGLLRAANLPEPLEANLTVRVTAISRDLDETDLVPLMEEDSV
ncbi:MAG: ATP-binding protein [Gemmatimonadales bacterium]|jgi:hypothetical protein